MGGKIVPSEITVGLIKAAMEANTREGNTLFLIDGFPRDEANRTVWNTVVGDFAKVLSVLFFTCSEECMQERLLERAKTSGRSDDNLGVIRKRFKTYTDTTMPIIEHYRAKNMVTEIDASKDVDTVY